MPFFTRVPPTAFAGEGVAADSESVYWTVDLSAVAYGRGSYTSRLRYPDGETTYLTGESSRHWHTIDHSPLSTQPTTSVDGQTAPALVNHAGAPHIAEGSLTYIYPHTDHPGCPNALTCLQDSDERPGYTLRTIITCAILGSPERRLTLRDVFLYVKAKYPFFKVQNKTFEASVGLRYLGAHC